MKGVGAKARDTPRHGNSRGMLEKRRLELADIRFRVDGHEAKCAITDANRGAGTRWLHSGTGPQP